MFKNNNPHALATELTGLSKVMGRADVKTQFQGTGAWTDDTVISVPAMDHNAQLDDREMSAMRGYHIHEVAHVTDTNSKLWNKKDVDKRTRSAWNAMEDVFIERKAQEQYEGARRNLQATTDMVLEEENKIDQQTRDEGGDPYEQWYDQIDYATLQMARDAMGYESPALQQYLNDMPQQLYQEALDFVDDALACNSTAETKKLAKQIKLRMEILGGKYDEDEPKKPPQQEPQEGDEGDESSSPPPKPRTGGTHGGEERMERANNAGKLIASKHKPKRGQHSERRPALIYKSYQDFYDYLMREFDANPALSRKKGLRHNIGSWAMPTNNDRYGELLKTLHGDTKQREYMARIARLLLAREDKRIVGGQIEGRLDRRRLPRVISGAKNVFAHKETLRTDDTMVTVAIDNSGSMDTHKIRLATACLNECLLKANADYELMAWTGYSGSRYDIKWNVPGLPAETSPYNTSGIVEVKNSVQRGNSPEVRKAISNLNSQSGVTPTFSCITTLAYHIIKHRQERKIMMFLTDGGPNGGNQEQTEVRSVVDAMRDVGIEVIPIGIKCDRDNMVNMFGDDIVMADFTNLGVTMLGQIEKILLGKSREAA